MSTLARTRRVIALVASIALATLSTSCSSWHTQTRPVREVIQPTDRWQTPPSKVRVRGAAEKPVVLHNPSIGEDSLCGIVKTESWIPRQVGPYGSRRDVVIFEERRTTMPLESVRSVEVRSFSLKKTAIYWGIPLGIFAALVAATWEPL